jgi:putative ABC transport system permease protein
VILAALHLAWRQLAHEPVRFATALAGVMFAAILVFMQLGFYRAAFDSPITPHRRMLGDLFLVHRESQAFFRMTSFHEHRIAQCLADPEVASAYGLRIGMVPWRNPWTRVERSLLAIGVDPHVAAFDDAVGLGPSLRAALRVEDLVLFDRLSHVAFGAVAGPFDARGLGDVARDRPPTALVRAEVGGRAVDVVGLVRLGTSFAADGNLITSDRTMLRMLPELPQRAAEVGVVLLRPGADPTTVRDRLRSVLPEDVLVFDRRGFEAMELGYWNSNSPIGFIFGFGAAMGLAVGLAIVHQVLSSDVAARMRQYATLKAIGYADRFLASVVLATAVVLAIGGFLPGVAVSAALYALAERATSLPLALTPAGTIGVFAMMLAMCALAGLFAMGKVRRADPADVF